MSHIIILNKPFQVLSQFTTQDDKQTLAHLIKIKGFYPAGRLDYDSEGLLILTNEGPVQDYIASPKFKMPKTYWVQVEGQVSQQQLLQLRQGVVLKEGKSKPCQAKQLAASAAPIQTLWPRFPAIRERKNIPTSWLSITITEGKNRQVRRMTAAVGLPTLRLIRASIGYWQLDGLAPGQYRMEPLHLPKVAKASTSKTSISKTSISKTSISKISISKTAQHTHRFKK